MEPLLKTSSSTLVLAFALMPLIASAQTPTCAAPGCNSVASDENSNTGMGTNALLNISRDPECGLQPFCVVTDNTAGGYKALGAGDFGNANTAFGSYALASNGGGFSNTAIGAYALAANVGHFFFTDDDKGYENTAVGAYALTTNTGVDNVAVGANALTKNSGGNNNVAVGAKALMSNSTAGSNSAFGASSLQFNTTGRENAAFGATALFANTTGAYNTATGFQALFANTTASGNTASGYRALYSSRSGADNTAYGFRALLGTTQGAQNTAIGSNALFANTTGSNNIALGSSAGYSVTGSNNIEIGAMGFPGDSGVIRIGSALQSAVYISGVTDTHLSGAPVYINSKGQLGLLASSERYKTHVASLADVSDKLRRLRPVSYHLKSDPAGDLQYGLIAEEVAVVLPELVIRDEAGKIQSVRYDELAPMLVREVQHQDAEIEQLKQQMARLQSMTEAMQTVIAEMSRKGTTTLVMR